MLLFVIGCNTYKNQSCQKAVNSESTLSEVMWRYSLYSYLKQFGFGVKKSFPSSSKCLILVSSKILFLMDNLTISCPWSHLTFLDVKFSGLHSAALRIRAWPHTCPRFDYPLGVSLWLEANGSVNIWTPLLRALSAMVTALAAIMAELRRNCTENPELRLTLNFTRWKERA